MSDITPDGRNKDLFICRNCFWVGYCCDWHQEMKTTTDETGNEIQILVHHFRCVQCFYRYAPLQKNDKLIKFNKVILKKIDNVVKVTPAWWTEAQEQRMINVLKEQTYRLQAAVNGESFETAFKVSYETVAKKIHGMTEPFESEGDHSFELTSYPQQCTGLDNERRTASLSACKGFAHCEPEGEAFGFFFKEALKVQDHQIFIDWDEIANELDAHLRSTLSSAL